MVVARSIAAALVGAFLFERLRVPAGALIGAMLGGAVLNLAGASVAPAPGWLRFVSFAVIGWLLGEQFTRDTIATLRTATVPILLVVGALLGAGALVAVVLRWLGLDPATAFLASSPGGISQMGAISAAIGANAPLVVAAHLIRVFTVVLTAPWIVRLLAKG